MPGCRFAVLLMALLASACGRVTDSEQLRLCRALLPVLHAEGAELREIRVAPAVLGKSGVRIDYAARDPGAERRSHQPRLRFRRHDLRARPARTHRRGA